MSTRAGCSRVMGAPPPFAKVEHDPDVTLALKALCGVLAGGAHVVVAEDGAKVGLQLAHAMMAFLHSLLQSGHDGLDVVQVARGAGTTWTERRLPT